MVGGLIDHVAGGYGCLGHGAAQLYSRVDGLGAGFIQFHHGQAFKLGGGIAIIGQVGPEFVKAKVRALGDGLARLLGVQPANAGPVGDGSGAGDSLAAQEPDDFRGHSAHYLNVEFVPWAQSGH